MQSTLACSTVVGQLVTKHLIQWQMPVCMVQQQLSLKARICARHCCLSCDPCAVIWWLESGVPCNNILVCRPCWGCQQYNVGGRDRLMPAKPGMNPFCRSGRAVSTQGESRIARKPCLAAPSVHHHEVKFHAARRSTRMGNQPFGAIRLCLSRPDPQDKCSDHN